MPHGPADVYHRLAFGRGDFGFAKLGNDLLDGMFDVRHHAFPEVRP